MYSYFYLHTYPWSKYLSELTGIKRLCLYPHWINNAVTVPTLFMYGTGKPFMFHGDSWLTALQQRSDGSDGIALPTGHWVFLEAPEQVEQYMDSFLTRVLGDHVQQLNT